MLNKKLVSLEHLNLDYSLTCPQIWLLALLVSWLIIWLQGLQLIRCSCWCHVGFVYLQGVAAVPFVAADR